MTGRDAPAPRSAEGKLSDRLAEVARKGPPPAKAKTWLWILFGVPVLVVGLLQAFGVTSSPVADKVLRERQERERATPQKPALPVETPVPPTPPAVPDPAMGAGAGR